MSHLKNFLFFLLFLVLTGNAWGQGYAPKASQISNAPSGNVSSTNVQSAINELDTKKVPITTTVNGHALSSNVTVSASDVGLSNVNNTSDANKPISTATQTALNGKQNTIATGTTAQYFKGDLSLGTFPTNVSVFANDSGYLTSATLGTPWTALGYITASALSPYSTTSAGDLRWLGINATAADSSKLNGQAASYYQTALGFTPLNATKLGTVTSTDFCHGDGSGNVTCADGNTYLQTLSGAAILAGIAGGQTLEGGTLTTNDLTLRANAADLTSGYVHFTDTTTATNATTAGVVMDGGLAVAKKIYATDLNVTNTITGNISGSAGTAGTAGTVTTAAQGNITSVGTLTGLTTGTIIPSAFGTQNLGSTLAPWHALFLSDSSVTYYTEFLGGAQSANITYTLPTAIAGGAGYVLTDAAGNGVLSWAAGGGGAVSSVSNTDGYLTSSPTTGAVVVGVQTTTKAAINITTMDNCGGVM